MVEHVGRVAAPFTDGAQRVHQNEPLVAVDGDGVRGRVGGVGREQALDDGEHLGDLRRVEPVRPSPDVGHEIFQADDGDTLDRSVAPQNACLDHRENRRHRNFDHRCGCAGPGAHLVAEPFGEVERLSERLPVDLGSVLAPVLGVAHRAGGGITFDHHDSARPDQKVPDARR